MKTPPCPISRRRFIGQTACAGFSLTGVLSTIGTLRLFNATASAQGLPGDDSKILVCLFLYGGNDANNMLVPRDLTAYDAYARDRGILALPRDTLLPLNLPADDGREFGLHPAMAPLQSIFNSQNMAMICNVGTLVAPLTKAEYQAGGAAVPPHLFSHNDQQVQWQTSLPDSPKKVGWGGRMADLLQSLNAGSDISMNISIAGSNFFQVGEEVVQYHVTPEGSIGLSQHDATWSPVLEGYHALDQMLGRSYGHLFEQEYVNIFHRAVANDTLLKTALENVPDHLDTFANSTLPDGSLNPVARQLRMILRLIEARQTLGMRRQIFFAALGGFDTHDAQLEDHDALLGQLSNALADFYHGTDILGIADQVTTFTASDFNRTYNSNGKGSDHAWGSHHLILGGAVQGGQLYGEVPVLEIQGPNDTGTRGSWIPTVSTDEMAATLARWFGISETDLPIVLPNIGRFAHPDLGFMNLA
ncbi:MAG: DUF1501 domain-containing protein [Verrucomicrobia bacterium]|nr:DUF1501 domain-containing protein [Kiritimatiellia bacterium]MCP5489376.1 DUF1501 domain-containing protein [Verrucomicrobiota bacterium]